tara:strand:+ start:795 stop:1172 length:378 start_codon:yes stop_codon:yes gene_type:complete
MKKLLLLSLTCSLQAAPPESFWKALHKVETNGRVGAIRGDKGAALGPYQIHRGYWKDSRVKGNYSQCASLTYSRKVATAYLKRYAPKSWASGNCKVLARVHNGGPKGYRKKSTLKYWRKIQEAMK